MLQRAGLSLGGRWAMLRSSKGRPLLDAEELPFARYALELMQTGAFKDKPRADDEILDGSRDEHLGWSREPLLRARVCGNVP